MSDAPPSSLSGLANGDARFRQILDTAPDAMIVVGPDGTIALVNLQAERLFGYQRAELLGKPLDALIPERFRAAHGGHFARFLRAPTAREMGSSLELVARRADGSEVPVEVSLGPLRTEHGVSVSAAIRDVTDRRRIEATARLAAERLSSAVESMQDAFALFDADEKLVLCNSAYRALFTTAVSGPLVGCSLELLHSALLDQVEFPSPEDRASFEQDRRVRRRELICTFDVMTRDGRGLRVIDRRTPEGGVVKTIWDLTEDMKMASELREARRAADAGSAAKSEFLSSMSHELRTPLNAVLGFAQLLQRDKKEPLSSRHQERVAQILKGGEHLLHLIDDILDLTRIEAGGVSISAEPMSVEDVLGEVHAALGPAADRAGVHVHVEPVAPGGLPMIHADRTRFAQILMNFASNAIKYNRRGGSVRLAARATASHVRVTVSDTGMGIPADKQDKLFQPFQRAGQETGPIEGTGIGLTIARRLAHLLGGEVGFESTPSVGSEFWVEMSALVAPNAGSVAPRPSSSPRPGQEARGLVLYVEDNPANVRFMVDLLADFDGVELLTAPTAEVGIELARTRTPDMIIMDINLPGMSGIEALAVLQGLEETKAIPVIALTAAASERDRERGEKAGFFRYLAKPIKVDELEAALQALLPAVKP